MISRKNFLRSCLLITICGLIAVSFDSLFFSEIMAGQAFRGALMYKNGKWVPDPKHSVLSPDAAIYNTRFDTGQREKIKLNKVGARKGYFTVKGEGIVAYKASNLFEASNKLDLGPTSTCFYNAEAYTPQGTLRTSADQPQAGIQGKGKVEFISKSDQYGIVPYVEVEGLRFLHSFKKSKVRMFGAEYFDLEDARVVRVKGKLTLEGRFRRLK